MVCVLLDSGTKVSKMSSKSMCNDCFFRIGVTVQSLKSKQFSSSLIPCAFTAYDKKKKTKLHFITLQVHSCVTSMSSARDHIIKRPSFLFLMFSLKAKQRAQTRRVFKECEALLLMSSAKLHIHIWIRYIHYSKNWSHNGIFFPYVLMCTEC